MIHILTTGGTIQGLDYKDEKNKSRKNGIQIEEFLKRLNISKNFYISNLLSKDSRFITDYDRSLIENEVRNSRADKVLITHGTFTMVETATYFGKLKLDKTIVLTGAFILGTDENTDAFLNLEFAIDALSYLNRGVYIAIHERIFYWDNVRKNIEKKRFETLLE